MSSVRVIGSSATLLLVMSRLLLDEASDEASELPLHEPKRRESISLSIVELVSLVNSPDFTWDLILSQIGSRRMDLVAAVDDAAASGDACGESTGCTLLPHL